MKDDKHGTGGMGSLSISKEALQTQLISSIPWTGGSQENARMTAFPNILYISKKIMNGTPRLKC